MGRDALAEAPLLEEPGPWVRRLALGGRETRRDASLGSALLRGDWVTVPISARSRSSLSSCHVLKFLLGPLLASEPGPGDRAYRETTARFTRTLAPVPSLAASAPPRTGHFLSRGKSRLRSVSAARARGATCCSQGGSAAPCAGWISTFARARERGIPGKSRDAELLGADGQAGGGCKGKGAVWSPGKPPTDEGIPEGTQRKWANSYSCF